MRDPRESKVWRYWSGVFKQAGREVRFRFGRWLGGLLVVGVASFLVGWARGDASASDALINALIVAGGIGLLALLGLVVSVPARDYYEMQSNKRDMYVFQQRFGARNALTVVAKFCRETAAEAEQKLLRNEAVDVGALHSTALVEAQKAEDALGERRPEFVNEAASFKRTVSDKPVSDVDAIAQLVELARVIDQQVYEGRYW